MEQFTMVLTKITKSLEIIEWVTSSVDEKVIMKEKWVTSRRKVVGEWMDMMLSQGTHLLSSKVTLINDLEIVKSEVDKTLDLLSQELET